MKKNVVELILHPVRMRILMALAGKERTARQINVALPDVPQATLYRHIKKLAQAKFIIAIKENRVRGTVEHVYALNQDINQLPLDEINKLNKNQHMRLFVAFIASLLGDYAAYLDRSQKIDLIADGVGYRKINLQLSDRELAEMSAALNRAIEPYLAHTPTPERRERNFSTILLPAIDTNE